ncbi:MAG TPA: hypothetical protein VE398_20220 [Acidobacteriota bacterium]|nr:hypothetical protein [Acidobacteriota bacterium]
MNIFKLHFRTARVRFRKKRGENGDARLPDPPKRQDDACYVLLRVDGIVSPEEHFSDRPVIRSGQPRVGRRMRVQVPDVPDAGHLLPKPCEEVRLVCMVVRASAVRVFGLLTRTSDMAYFEALSVDFTEEGHGELKVIEPLRVPQDLAVDAILQRQSLFHLVDPPVNDKRGCRRNPTWKMNLHAPCDFR